MNVEVLEQLREHDPVYLTLLARRGTLELGRNLVQFRAVQLTQPVGVLLHQGRVLSPHFFTERTVASTMTLVLRHSVILVLTYACTVYSMLSVHKAHNMACILASTREPRQLLTDYIMFVTLQELL